MRLFNDPHSFSWKFFSDSVLSSVFFHSSLRNMYEILFRVLCQRLEENEIGINTNIMRPICGRISYCGVRFKPPSLDGFLGEEEVDQT